MNDLPTLTNESLIARLECLARNERRLQVEVLRLLAELDERRAVVQMGYSGIWDFCRRRLKFSEATATRRVNVARAARRFPEILTMLDDGRLNLASAAKLLPGLNEANAQELLNAAAGKSRREVQKLVVPASSSHPVTHRVAFSAGDDVVAKLEKLQELLGGATLAEVVDRAADLLLAKVDRTKRHERREERARKKAPRPITKAPRPRPTERRRPPRALSDQVTAEAGQRCTYVSPEGVRCTATKHLTIDHIRPFALGGSSTDLANLRCYCLAHNLMAGRQSFPQWSRSV